MEEGTEGGGQNRGALGVRRDEKDQCGPGQRDLFKKGLKGTIGWSWAGGACPVDLIDPESSNESGLRNKWEGWHLGFLYWSRVLRPSQGSPGTGWSLGQQDTSSGAEHLCGSCFTC